MYNPNRQRLNSSVDVQQLRDMADRAGMLILNTCDELDDMSADLQELRKKYIGLLDTYSDDYITRRYAKVNPQILITRCALAEEICDVLDDAYSKVVALFQQLD